MRLRLPFISIAVLLFGCLALESVYQLRREWSPSVLLLTVESLREDLVNEAISPHLLEAAKTAYQSEVHRGVSGWTGANMITLLTGLTPFQAGVHTRGQSVDSALFLPLEQLSEKGYRVAGLQGFMTMDLYRNLGLSIDDVGSDLFFWLTECARKNEPFFLWEHYVQTHLPYKEGDGYEIRIDELTDDKAVAERLEVVRTANHIEAGSISFQPEDVPLIYRLHEANVKEFDDWFAEFWKFFHKSGLHKNCLLIVTADHGDEHGERGNVGHASTNRGGHLHEEILRVPLFIWVPEKLNVQGRTAGIKQSDHADVIVTILGLLGVDIPQYLEGRNLLETEEAVPWFGMTSGGGFSEKDPVRVGYFEYGLIDENLKLLWRIDREGEESFKLYDLKEDPGEKQNIYEHRKEAIGDMKSRLREKIENAQHRPVRFASRDGAMGKGPKWIFPNKSGTYSYAQMEGKFYFEWEGDSGADYLLQYRAGVGDNLLEGELEVKGTKKDFGSLSKRYWKTWVVPASPIRARVRRLDSGGWSDWISMEARE